MNSLKKLANRNFHGYLLDTEDERAKTKRKKLKEVGFTPVDRETYKIQRSMPLYNKYMDAAEKQKNTTRNAVAAGTAIGAGVGALMPSRVLGAGVGAVSGALTGGVIGSSRKKKNIKNLNRATENAQARLDASLNARLLRHKGDTEFYIKTGSLFKNASFMTRVQRFFPSSRRMEKAQQGGRMFGGGKPPKPRGPSAPGHDAPLALGAGKTNRGGGAMVRYTGDQTLNTVQALDNPRRNLYMLAGGSLLAGGAGGYALANSNNENK